MGASKPEAGGDYFAWGETKPKSAYSWDNYKWGTYDWETNESNFTKYTNSSGKTTLDAADDAATQNMGKRWRMPTAEEFEELIGYCYGSWTEENGIKGYKFTSVKNAAFVFLPASGYRRDGSLSDHGSYGGCWSSLLYPGYDYYAFGLGFSSGYCGVYDGSRSVGHTVRAVCQ